MEIKEKKKKYYFLKQVVNKSPKEGNTWKRSQFIQNLIHINHMETFFLNQSD